MKKNLLHVCTLLLCALLCAALLVGCGESKAPAAEIGTEESAAPSLVGTCSYSDDYVYTFNADGTGNYKVGTTDMPFTYTDNGTAVAITFEGNTAPMELNYTIDGSKLTITDSFGEPVVYNKK